jgi:nucleoside-diphosphate-sugar epimerase
MPRVLIAGCGYVGTATADLLFSRGWDVEGWTRSQESVEKLGAKPYAMRAVDIANRVDMANCPGNFDAVIHCASTGGGGAEVYRQLYLDGARNLTARFPTATIIFTSSTSVYAQSDGSWVSEESATEPPQETGRILLETEKLVLAHGGIVARLAGIYGPTRSALLERFVSGEAFIDPEHDRFVNQAHRDDIATALAVLLDVSSTTRLRSGEQTACGEIYNIVDNEPILQSECYRWLAAKLNRPLPPIGRSPVPWKRGASNKRVSNAKLRAIGWEPQYPNFVAAMEKSILPSFAATCVQKSST